MSQTMYRTKMSGGPGQQNLSNSQIQHETNQLLLSLGNNNSASLKGKLQNLDDLVKVVCEELNAHRKELQTLKSQKDVLENTLQQKLYDINKMLTNELNRLCEDMKKQYSYETGENSKVLVLINTMKQEQQQIKDKLKTIDDRILLLEDNIGKNRY